MRENNDLFGLRSLKLPIRLNERLHVHKWTFGVNVWLWLNTLQYRLLHMQNKNFQSKGLLLVPNDQRFLMSQYKSQNKIIKIRKKKLWLLKLNLVAIIESYIINLWFSYNGQWC